MTAYEALANGLMSYREYGMIVAQLPDPSKHFRSDIGIDHGLLCTFFVQIRTIDGVTTWAWELDPRKVEYERQ